MDVLIIGITVEIAICLYIAWDAISWKDLLLLSLYCGAMWGVIGGWAMPVAVFGNPLDEPVLLTIGRTLLGYCIYTIAVSGFLRVIVLAFRRFARAKVKGGGDVVQEGGA